MKTKTKNYCATFRYRIEVFLSFFINPQSWHSMERTEDFKWLYVSSLIYPIFFAIRSWVSNSYVEPNAISRKCAKSVLEGLEEPSAILDAIETAARCIWSHKPFFSNQGISPVSLYTWVERFTASCHTGYSLKLRAFFSIRTKIVIVFVVAQQHFVFVQPWLFSLLLSNLYNIVVLT